MARTRAAAQRRVTRGYEELIADFTRDLEATRAALAAATPASRKGKSGQEGRNFALAERERELLTDTLGAAQAAYDQHCSDFIEALNNGTVQPGRRALT